MDDELWLVCEGEPASVDVILLQQVFDGVLGAEVLVAPACGSSPSPVARFLRHQRGGKAAFVRDRDYRPRGIAEASMTDGKPGFFWRRHSIENYLLPPPVILRAFQNLRERSQQARAGWLRSLVNALPEDTEEVSQSLRECARRKAAEEACRFATHRLWASLPREAKDVQKRDPDGPGTEDPADWREVLCLEAERVRLAADRAARCPDFERDSIIHLFDTIYAEITSGDYFEERGFLVDFHGKSLLRNFHRWLESRGTPSFLQTFIPELIRAASDVYREDRTVYGRDDFRDLANGVRSLAGLAPLP